jgi:glyoxylase-like metal-dependent hydrolase (beta-lactamase superfamily II)
MKHNWLCLVGLCLALLLCAGSAEAQQVRNSHLLSADTLTRLSPHVWMITGSPNIAIVVGSKATLVVDNGLGTRNGAMIVQAALKLSAPGAKLYLTTTHYHAEHATGDGGFPPGTVLIRPRAQQEELEAEGQKLIDLFSSRSEEDRTLLADVRYLRPAILFDQATNLDLGDVRVRLYWFGPAHTKGDELVMVEPDSVLISGDVVQNKTGPYFYCETCTPKSWGSVMDKIARQLHPRIVMPDHSPPGDASLIAEERAFMADLQTRMLALKKDGRSADEAGKILTAEMMARYPGWSGLARVSVGVEHGYREN